MTLFYGEECRGFKQIPLKGKQVAVEGELRQSRWEQDGQNRSRVEIHASNIQLLGGSAGGGQQGSYLSRVQAAQIRAV